jgi:cysteinyl-tRNA synthetase
LTGSRPSATLPDMDEQFEELAETLKNKAEKIGLYMRNHVIATQAREMDESDGDMVLSVEALRAKMEMGDVRVAIMAVFTLGDVAFSERVQNPEAFDLDTQFRQLMPTEHELKADEIRDRLRQQGGKLFDFEDEDDED